VLRRLALGPLVFAVAIASTGWLYIVRSGALPGPKIGEALPLDELAKHSSVSMLAFAIVWLGAAALLGLAARWARMERLTAALVLGVATAAVLYLANGVSIALTRQISAQQAFHVAMRLESVYLPGAIVGLVVALLATTRRYGRRAPAVVALVVATAASLELLHTILPGGEDSGLIRDLTPDAVGPLAHAAYVFVGLALLLAARGLARRRRRAWQVAVVLAALSTTLHVLHRLGHGTIVSAVVLILLVATRNEFTLPGDEQTRFQIVTRTGVAAATIAAYGVLALWVNRLDADQPFSLRFAAHEILAGLLGLDTKGSPHLTGNFGEWFPLSLLLLGLGATVWIVAGWLAPWRHRVRREAREHEHAQALVRAWGADTLAPFVLRADKSYFFSENVDAFVAYRVVGGVAIVSGDPIGPPAAFGPLVAQFVEHAHRCDWRVAILGASERWLELYRGHGLHALYHGDEAVVDTASFSLDGRPIRKVRQSVHRLEKAGYRARVLRPSEIDGAMRADLEAIAADWRGDLPERGFVMALDALFSLGDDDAVFVVGFDADGRPHGFLHFAVAHAISALSLSSMPRVRASTPNGFNEWLICETVAWAREHGFERVSLNFSPFAALLAPETDLSALQELQRRALLRLKGRFQLDNLLAFNRKFFPRWERRFIVYERRRDLPRVGIAALAAEAYLPFQAARK
jgi:lysyl-tRNA synthetase class 2